MRAVAPGNVGRLARLRCSIRPFQTRENTAVRLLEAQELRLALDLDAGLGQAIDQQTLVLVLGKDQRIRKRAETRAHLAEDRMCRLLAGHPEIRGDGLPSTLDDRVGDARSGCTARACVPARQARAMSSPASAVLSTILTRTPNRVSHRANTKPVGPAPTMRTSASRIDDAVIV